MIATGLRAAMQGLGNMARQAPVATAGIAGTLGYIGYDSMTPDPKHMHKRQRERFYRSVETHKPGDALMAYDEDDFFKQAFEVSPDYDTYSALIAQGAISPESALTDKEFQAIKKNRTYAQEYAKFRERDLMRNSNTQNWGENWEASVQRHPKDDELAMRRLALLEKARRRGLHTAQR